MVRLARTEVFDLNEVAVAYVYARTVRRCLLLFDDVVFGKSLDLRKVWIEDYLHQSAATFGIDLLGFAILLVINETERASMSEGNGPGFAFSISNGSIWQSQLPQEHNHGTHGRWILARSKD